MTPQEALDQAKCVACLPSSQQQAIGALAALAIIAAGGGGGGGGSTQVFSGHYGGEAPTQTPTTSAAIAYDLDTPIALWVWNGSAWVEFDSGLILRGTTMEREAYSVPTDTNPFWFDTDTETYWYWNGSDWVEITSGGGSMLRGTTDERNAYVVPGGTNPEWYDTDLNLIFYWNGYGWFLTTGEKLVYYGGTVDPQLSSWTVVGGGAPRQIGNYVVVDPLVTSITLSGLSLDGQLDISGLGSIANLAGDSQQITSVRFGNNNGLTDCFIGNNAITSVPEIQSCSTLTTLSLYGNQFSSIDLQGINTLTSLDVQNQVSGYSLNVSGIPTNLVFDVSGRNIGQLRMIGCSGIGYFEGVYGSDITLWDCTGCSSMIQIWASDCPNLATLVCTGCSSVAQTQLYNCASIESVDLSPLVACPDIDCHDSTSLDSVTPPPLSPVGTVWNFNNCALDQASVNALIMACDIANPGTLDTSGGTSASPSGAAIAQKTALNGAGWTVTTN